MNHNAHADMQSRSVIDTAIGVLVALHRCSEQDAFNEIAHAVRETGVGLGSLSRALVTLASGTTIQFDHRAEVVGLWGDLFDVHDGTREQIA
jgi:ANTAR domain